MPYPLPLTRTEAYLAYKAGVIQQSDLKPSLAVPRNGIDAWLAYWTGIAEDYPKREDGTPHILQEEEAYIAYLCGVLDEYPEKCLRRVGAYLRYIISARWGRPDHPLNREELYLSLIETQFIPSGDPSSDIVIDGTAKAPFVDVKLYGDTYQQSYEGKNLLDFPNGSFTSNGVTSVWENGKVTISGTATSNQVFVTNYLENTLTAGTYTFSMGGAEAPRRFIFRTFDANNQTIASYILEQGNTSAEVTIAGTEAKYRIVMLAQAETTYDETDYFQLESGSTATSFEPFVGGQPSPNPEYPQPIQTVTGVQTVEIVGKNKYPFNDTTWSSTQTTSQWSFQNGSTNAYGATITDKTDYKFTLPAGTYTMTAFDITSNIINIQACTNGESSETIVTSPSNINSENLSSTITLTETTTLCVRYRTTNPSLGIGNTKIQIEQAESASSFAPYSKQTYPIDLGGIQLCGLGDDGNGEPLYKDYIWKDGSDWKIRKNTNRFTFETRKLMGLSKQPLGFTYNTDNNPLEGKHIPLVGECSHFDVESTTTTWTALNKTGMNSGGALWFRTAESSQGDTRTIEEFGQWLVDAGVSFVYALATPTDTVITNQALIDQLNALKRGGAEEGTTYIKVSATDPNLPAKLYVEAPKYE